MSQRGYIGRCCRGRTHRLFPRRTKAEHRP
jgi:hypothetical protein